MDKNKQTSKRTKDGESEAIAIELGWNANREYHEMRRVEQIGDIPVWPLPSVLSRRYGPTYWWLSTGAVFSFCILAASSSSSCTSFPSSSSWSCSSIQSLQRISWSRPISVVAPLCESISINISTYNHWIVARPSLASIAHSRLLSECHLYSSLFQWHVAAVSLNVGETPTTSPLDAAHYWTFSISRDCFVLKYTRKI